MKHIRDILAILWSVASISLLTYTLVTYGHEKEILTLIIGTLTGTIIGGIYGFYFSASHKPSPTSSESITVTETSEDSLKSE